MRQPCYRLALTLLLLAAAIVAEGQNCATAVGAVRRCAPFTRIDADGSLLVAAELEPQRLVILDVSDPNAPVDLGAYLATARIDDVAISGNLVLAVVGSQIEVLSVADPRNPVRLARTATVGAYRRVTVDGTLAVALDVELRRYDIIDLTNPAAPVVVATLANSFFAEDVALSGTLLLGGAGGIDRVDLANRTAPVRQPFLMPIPEIIYRNVAATSRVAVLEETFGDVLHISGVQGLNLTSEGGRFSSGPVLDVAVAGCRAFYLTQFELRTIAIENCVAACATCVPSETNVCLANGRFSVQAAWRTPDGVTGVGRRISVSDNTAGFWFFGPANTEVVFKLLDGCVVNGRYWFFAAGLTNVEVTITVTDTRTGAVRRYVNPLNRPFDVVQDTTAFAGCP